MKRVVEKVKDIVEVCPFTPLHDFAADPALTLAGYYFTDITSDLMAKWLDRISSVKPGQGAALALAGFRGVGKSHFIAAMAAIVSRPDLRSRVVDYHVVASAGRLSRRHGPVSFVHRGSGETLFDELKLSIAQILAVDPGTLSDSLHDLLITASKHAGEVPLVLLIDTAPGRESRVARDDGAILSQIAEAAKALGIFVGVALDDDISGADGANSSIAGTFSIDYLDQEHLYKIVDSYIFSKHQQKLPVLRDIYEYYREVLPGFRWSEQRFSALYPMHPATLEIAPLIRLYIHDFALLSFAAAAGEKILGRPANSLIGLDEVFHSVEKPLREVPDLTEAFAAFDKLEREVVAKVPVHFRLPAKLVLKGLMVLSLNGQGATPSEIAASMMIFDEDSPGSSTADVAKLLDSFADALPDRIEKTYGGDGEAKYGFKLASAEDVGDFLAEAVKNVSDDVVWGVLLRQTAEKFSDFDILAGFGTHPTTCSVVWRNAIRRGEIVWTDDGDNATEAKGPLDWTIFVESGINGKRRDVGAQGSQQITWRLSELTADEKNTIRRHHLLQTNAEVREQLGEGLITASHVNSIAVEKIWQRLFLQDGVLGAGDAEYRFDEDARSAHSFEQLFTDVLAPIFEAQYPSHPEFSQLLGMKQASNLIADFFSGALSNNAEAQNLAEAFAFPLGLAVRHGDQYVPVLPQTLLDLPVVKLAFDGSGSDQGKVIPLAEISSRMQAPPVGLTREAQHLILSALVAQREFEFITSSGNRINHRSLDLQIVWDDIVGVAKPLNEAYSSERLVSWAKLLTGNSELRSLDRAADKLLIIDSFSNWLKDWKRGRFLDEFDALPDENLNAAIWRTAANLRKSFGPMAETIDAMINDELDLDQCVYSIAEIFSDSEEEFEKKKSDLQVLIDFTQGVSRRSQIAQYLSLCDLSNDSETERAREALLDIICPDHLAAASSSNGHTETLWNNFRDSYASHYAEKHDAVMTSTASGETLNEILGSDNWSAFENLSTIQWFDRRYVSRAKALSREIRQLYCKSDPRHELESKPYCTCSFSLPEFDRLITLPDQLRRLVNDGLEAFRAKLTAGGEKLFASADTDEMKASIKQVFAGGDDLESLSRLSSQDVRILKLAAERVTAAESNNSRGEDFNDILPNDMRDWENEIDRLEVFANIDR